MDESTVVYVDASDGADDVVAALRAAGFVVDRHATAADGRAAVDGASEPATDDADVGPEDDVGDGDGSDATVTGLTDVVLVIGGEATLRNTQVRDLIVVQGIAHLENFEVALDMCRKLANAPAQA